MWAIVSPVLPLNVVAVVASLLTACGPVAPPISTPMSSVADFLAMPIPATWGPETVAGCREAIRQLDDGGWEETGQALATEAVGPPDLWSLTARESARTLSQVLMKASQFCQATPMINKLFGAVFTEEYQYQGELAERYWWETWRDANTASLALRQVYMSSQEGESPAKQRVQLDYFREQWSLFLLNLSAFNREIRFASGSQ
ncbi:hypothetical protein ACFLX9_02590 [Chloroflexota bacterium]